MNYKTIVSLYVHLCSWFVFVNKESSLVKPREMTKQCAGFYFVQSVPTHQVAANASWQLSADNRLMS